MADRDFLNYLNFVVDRHANVAGDETYSVATMKKPTQPGTQSSEWPCPVFFWQCSKQ